MVGVSYGFIQLFTVSPKANETELAGNKSHAHRHRHFRCDAGWFQRAGGLVNGEDYDAIAVLVGDEAELAARVEGKIPRCLDAFRLMTGRGQLAALRIDREHRDAVVAAIRAVEKLA